MKASFQSFTPWYKIDLSSEAESEFMGRKVHSQPPWVAKIREGGHSVPQTKHMGLMDI